MATKRRQTAKRKKPAKASKQGAGKKKLVRAASKKRSSAAGAKARGRKASARKKSAPKAAATAAPKKSATAKKAAKAVAPRKAKAIAPKKIAVSEKRPAAPPPAAPSVAVAPPPKRKAPVRKQSGTAASRPEQPARTPYYITTAISYPNGPPHIGHAYEVIATDAIARFMRLDGYDVYLPHRHRRARPENAADCGARGPDAAAIARPQRAAVRGDGEAAGMLERRTSSTPPRGAITAPRRQSGSAWRRPATSISTNMPAGIRCATKPITPRMKRSSTSRRCASRSKPARRSNGWRRRAISSASRPIRTSCSSCSSGRIMCCRRSG